MKCYFWPRASRRCQEHRKVDDPGAPECDRETRMRGLTSLLFIGVCLLSAGLYSQLKGACRLAPYILVPSDTSRDPLAALNTLAVTVHSLPHAGHVVHDVNGTIIRAHYAAASFHVFGPRDETHCARPEPTHITAERHHCRWAVNGGGFDETHEEPCDKGFFVSDGSIVGVGEGFPEFGITDAGEWIVGTFSAAQARSLGIRNSVNGVSWLVRDGVSVVEHAGPIRAHTTIGVDGEGTLMLLEVDGREASGYGRTSEGMASLLLEYGAVHAIDLDGGDSSTVVVDNQVVNHPTGAGHWEPVLERRVESIVCLVSSDAHLT